MTLAAIRARLYRGYDPTEFGAKHIGGGFFRQAYRCGDYVIKRQHKHCGHYRKKSAVRKELASLGIMMCPTWTVRRPHHRAWIIQPYCRRVNWTERTKRNRADLWDAITLLDVHEDNLGYDRQWNLVAFDY